jgi:L-alanine-DL-glutamate epimerase-like enolase superfamily enzyme
MGKGICREVPGIELVRQGNRKRTVKLAEGEGAHNFYMAQPLIDYGRVSYIQVDCGRIGGIGTAKRVADYAASTGVTFVNHTLTSHLALSASLQPYAGLRLDEICEYPFAAKSLARELTSNHLERDKQGYLKVPDTPAWESKLIQTPLVAFWLM